MARRRRVLWTGYLYHISDKRELIGKFRDSRRKVVIEQATDAAEDHGTGDYILRYGQGRVWYKMAINVLDGSENSVSGAIDSTLSTFTSAIEGTFTPIAPSFDVTGVINRALGSIDVNASGTFTSGTPPTEGKRWNPGHYTRPQGNPFDGQTQAEFLAKMQTALSTWTQEIPELKGAMVPIPWGWANPTGNIFDLNFIRVLVDQARSQGQRMLIMLMHKSPGGTTNPSIEAPTDLFSDIVPLLAGASSGGHIARLWDTDVRTRYKACMQAIGDEFDDDDAFEGILTNESTGSQPDDPTYSSSAYGSAWQDVYVGMEAAFPKANVFPQINSLAGELTGMYEKCYDLRIGISGPDAREVQGWEFFAGRDSKPGASSNETPPRVYRKLIPRGITVSRSSFDTSPPRSAADIIILGQTDQDITHYFWINQTVAGNTFQDTKDAIQANPSVWDTCPTRYLSCSSVGGGGGGGGDPVFPEEHFPQVSVNPGAAFLTLPSNNAMLVIGMSNTNHYIDALIPLAGASKTEIVNGAIGGKAAQQWASSSNDAWTTAAATLTSAGYTSSQVSVVFIGIADRTLNDTVDAYQVRLEANLRQVVLNVRSKYPSAIMVMNGLHNEFWTDGHPEPHAWSESGVADRIIADNADVYWGPYIWNPMGGRSGDGFNLLESDHGTNPDGSGDVHLEASGNTKIANSIMTWFNTDSVGQSIFF